VIINNVQCLLGYTTLLSEKSNVIGDYPNSLNDLARISKLCSDIAASMLANPELYKQPPDLAIWNKLGVTMDHFPEAMMHILFLGIEKAVLTKAQYFVAKHHLCKAHLAALQGILEPICVMALVWCKALPFSKDGATGAKVSENYLADARLMPWFLSPLSTLEEDPIYTPPTSPKEQWTAVQNKSWLHAHGFKTKGNAAELRDRVADAMDNGGDTVNLRTRSGGRTHDLNCVIQTWHATVAWIMAHHVLP
jgi:hypothetical protein